MKRPHFPDIEAAAALEHRHAQLAITLRRIPERFQWATFDAPELAQRLKNPEALGKARRATVGNVLLAGAPGCGKTSLACAMLRAIIDAGDTRVQFARANTLARAREEYPFGRGDAPEVERAKDASVLLLDDIGAESARSDVVADIIAHRHDAERRTIITTGYGFLAMVERYGDGIGRRLTEGTTIIRCMPVTSDGRKG